MAHAALLEDPPELGHHITAGPAGGLVYQQDPVHFQTSSITASSISFAFSGGQAMVQPAAMAWPPAAEYGADIAAADFGTGADWKLAVPLLRLLYGDAHNAALGTPARPARSSQSSSVAPASLSMARVTVATVTFPSRWKLMEE